MPPTALSAFHPSPKRKRDQPPPIPLLNTALRPASPPPRGSPTPDSPRNAVAEQFGGMTLTSVSAIPMSPLSPMDDGLRKKPKLQEGRVDSGTSLDQYLARAQEDATLDGKRDDTITAGVARTDSRTIPETPEAQQPRIFSDIISFAQQPTAFVSSSTNASSQTSATTSPRSKSKNRTGEPSLQKKLPSPPLSTLTWQDSEITGHLADPTTDPDDDGTGLNGIGFRPTPAIAQARAQRRRQQVLDWKAREAREARAKRSERRRRGVGGTSSREATVEREVPVLDLNAGRRMVKFAV
ncbi:hypothetical protein K458DRAFT_387857 [Lentithecium fluviatile CBS 122367]|uniref:Uncharacterized protein n=1 Tax=Lentithecium fluviatile CBS 122367 TaxID=1168545 RepID=A0A6G1J6T5_9PLEO|nr:hypothetical protein K458DRAFT_387857 [Lentithecium fluviatile CBS 122367]